MTILKPPTASERQTLEQIVGIICLRYRLAPEALRSTRQSDCLIHPRQLAMYVAHYEMGIPSTHTAEFFNCSSHATVLHACEQIRKLLSKSPATKLELLTIRNQIQQRKAA